MKAWYLAILLCVIVCMSGCVSSQIIPPKEVTLPLRTISILPIECPPLLLHPASKEDETAIGDLIQSSTRPIGESAPKMSGSGATTAQLAAPLVLAPNADIRTGASVLVVIGGVALLAEAANAGKAVPGETATIQKSQIYMTGMPSAEYANTAANSLRKTNIEAVNLISGYIKLPITDRSTTWHLENWLAPIRRLYSEDMSSVDYAALDSNHSDAVIEIGVMNYEYYSERLLLQVFVRLIDPYTKHILGRVRNYSSSKAGQLAPLLKNDAEGMKRLVFETGNRLLAKCLAEIGLTPGPK